ncbi:hypothetical protein JQ632_36735 [Bradyrhizobium liaoningense]|nr:hypothetical protein [Bradyrhizobium liaoningense]
MPAEVRRVFRSVKIERPADQFVQLPSEKSLYRELAIFQKVAGTNLVAKGLLSRSKYLSGQAMLIVNAVPDVLRASLHETNEIEYRFMHFLLNEFGALDLAGTRGLRLLTGLVRRQP